MFKLRIEPVATIVAIVFALGCIPFEDCVAEGRRARPLNVVLILADDLGYADTDLYGPHSLHRTPNLLDLQDQSRTYTNAYSPSPVCSPARASILTGLWPARTGFTQAVGHVRELRLNPVLARGSGKSKTNVVTSATALKIGYRTLSEDLHDAGFVCGHFGKWHVGCPSRYRPLQTGFDADWAQTPWSGPGGYFDWYLPSGARPAYPGEHVEARNASEAIRFLEKHKNERFFLNFWAFSVHAPFEADPGAVAMFSKFKNRRDAKGHPVYAAMVQTLDEQIGRIVRKLKNTYTDSGERLFDNTVLIVTSDNGGPVHRTRGRAPMTDNGPLRGGKATGWDGGYRVPLLIRAPGRTPPGSFDATPVSLVDLYPTILQLARIEPKSHVDGESLVATFHGVRLRPRFLFGYYPHPSGRRVPDGTPPSVWAKWKGWTLVRFFHDNRDQSHREELYYTEDDVGQVIDLADVRPGVTALLSQAIDDHLRQTRAVVPTRNPRYRGAR